MIPEPILTLDQVSRRFGSVSVVDRVSLAIGRGEFFSLVGPSGCGKTTTLRLIAGFEPPDSGEIAMLGQSVEQLRPYQRPIGMVFQHAALFPHLDVAGNIAFGLEERRVARAEIAIRVARALELVRLDPAMYATRRPAELSGGQRQRVALARALVLEPPILLLDEPLAALDLQLRKAMQLELRELNQRLGITFILVTHDQEEALAMSDRIAVMDGGRIEQVGTPAEIYHAPRTTFVARFIGEANVLQGRVDEWRDGIAWVRGNDDQRWRVVAPTALNIGADVCTAVRPERMMPHGEGETGDQTNSLTGTVAQVIFRGEILHLLVATTALAEPLRVALPNSGIDAAAAWPIGRRIGVRWRAADARTLD